jgi:hypothetical protein
MKNEIKQVHRSIRFDCIFSQHLLLLLRFVFFKSSLSKPALSPAMACMPERQVFKKIKHRSGCFDERTNN